MKIAILTLPLHTNYGGILQAYALQTVLERMGHEVSVIEKIRKPYRLKWNEAPSIYMKRIVTKLIGKSCTVFYEQKLNREIPIIRQNTDLFITKYIHRKNYQDFNEIEEGFFDAFVVGSDQVWRAFWEKQCCIVIDNVYLKFTEGWNVKRMSYAASFGTDEWDYTEQQTTKCRRLIQMFDAVSVREESGVSLCRDYLNVDAQHVLDPTMLLEKEDYIKLFEVAKISESRGNLLCYILDESQEKTNLIDGIAKEKSMKPFMVNSKVENMHAPLSERIQPPVEEWIRGFYDAKFVVTDSFHACVFSIIFQKPFIVIGNKERGLSRFESLLSCFGLTERMVSCVEDANKILDNTIDWKKVNEKLVINRFQSKDFLKTNLKYE